MDDPNNPGAKWTGNWREAWASGDDKKLNWAKRYASPQAMIDAAWSAQERISKGELAQPLPENPSTEQLIAYRKSHGIPEKPEGYLEALPKELHLEAEDRAIIAPYLPIMHELNLGPKAAARLIQFRQAEVERQINERTAADTALRTKTEDAMRQEWGGEYRANVNHITSFLQSRLGEEGFHDIMNARTPSGDPLLGSPGVLRAFAQLAVEHGGGNVTITLPDGGLADAKGVATRMAEIVKLMANPSSEYWRGPKANAIQAEYRKLVDFEEQNKRRGG
ncbi:MAG TPA: hypothetical protein VFX20_18135 [Steroidobacteraceae bacterium]|nr:hypothetical protein [Steroidobacteraceae bacterium]